MADYHVKRIKEMKGMDCYGEDWCGCYNCSRRKYGTLWGEESEDEPEKSEQSPSEQVD